MSLPSLRPADLPIRTDSNGGDGGKGDTLCGTLCDTCRASLLRIWICRGVAGNSNEFRYRQLDMSILVVIIAIFSQLRL